MRKLASNFTPKLSLLLWERKSVTLQQMFIDSLEVELNLKMSKNISDQHIGDKSRTYKVDKDLYLEEQHELETFSFHSILLIVRKKLDKSTMY